jgi:hypothetical protein
MTSFTLWSQRREGRVTLPGCQYELCCDNAPARVQLQKVALAHSEVSFVAITSCLPAKLLLETGFGHQGKSLLAMLGPWEVYHNQGWAALIRGPLEISLLR